MKERPLENGWLVDTPVGDTLLRQFAFNQAELNETIARAAGGRTDRDDDVSLADTGGPVGYLNQALLLRPLVGAGDPLLDTVDVFFASSTGRTVTLLSIWPTPDLSGAGWSLVGHPAFVARPPAPGARPAPAGVAVRSATTPADLLEAERIVIDGYPVEEARDHPPGSVLPPALLDTDVLYRIGSFEGDGVAVGGRYVAHGVVNLCLAATLPAARRRGVWEQLVWARVNDAPDSPAVAFTSDFSRPGFVRMGFLPITRFTMWARTG